MAAGLIGLVGHRSSRRWGSRPHTPVPGFAEATGRDLCTKAVLIAYVPTRPAGLALGALVCLAVFATLIRHREAAHLPPGVVLFAAILATAFGVVTGPA